MKTFIFTMLLVTQSLLGLEWKPVKLHPVPHMQKVLFYDSIADNVEIGVPEVYKAILWDIYEIETNVTHWIDLDDLPKINQL